MVPDVGSASPARQLKKVLLPAPLGPIRPMISPSATSRSAPSTALNAPNALTMPRASRNTGRLLRGHRTRRHPCGDRGPERRDPAGLEPCHQKNDRAVDDEGD